MIKKTAKKRVVEVIRRMAQGSLERANEIVAQTLGGKVLNTAFIERFNGTMRERLASLSRRCRHAARKVSQLEAGMWLVGCTYNFCWPHRELSRRATRVQARRGEVLITPALASGLTNHIWSVRELLTFRVAPPAWVPPRRRGRPPTLEKAGQKTGPPPSRPLRKRSKGVVCPSTS
ncbi:transposase [Ktedonobacter robiniae]|uniref:transposase n=1 Tax=Ktedonobacter robiniae TaxID=2778365 RepID=UPI001F3856E1|nr:transposase [Ktedonobacter robiniae]